MKTRTSLLAGLVLLATTTTAATQETRPRGLYTRAEAMEARERTIASEIDRLRDRFQGVEFATIVVDGLNDGYGLNLAVSDFTPPHPRNSAPTSTLKLLERLEVLDEVEATHGVEAPIPIGGLAPFGLEVCKISHHRVKYEANQWADGGGYLTVHGILEPGYPVGSLGMPELHVVFWDAARTPKEYLGKDMDFFDHPGGTFEVMIESRRPGKLEITYTCQP